MKHPEIKSIPISLHVPIDSKYTIAIPTYLRSKLLDETINSVFRTISESGIKVNIIVVDNNPTRGDETEKLMEKYREMPYISYYKNEKNIGMIGNWNRCILLAKTKYVILLHDDDLVEPDFMKYIQKAIAKIGSDNLGILKPKENRWKDNGKPYEFHHFQGDLRLEKVIAIENYNGFVLGAPTGCLLNREMVLKTGGFEEFDKNAAADLAYFIKLNFCSQCYKINYPLVVYRITANESLKIEIQYLGYERCYKIVSDLLKRYYVPSWLFKRFWAKFSERWGKWIEAQFNMQFKLDEAYKRISLPQYSTFEKTAAVIILKIYERLIILPFNGKIKIIDVKSWKRTIQRKFISKHVS